MSCLTASIDPESPGRWDPLDGELIQKLDKRRYVSLSRDRQRIAQGLKEDEDEDDGAQMILNEEALSLFQLGMPGVMTAEEVEREFDLDHWLLLVHGTLIHMEDLVGWEDANIRDPQSVKGIVAELAAVLGRDLYPEAAVVLFD